MKDPHEIIDHLAPGDALAILRRLAASDAQLAMRIAETAIACLARVEPEEVADVVYSDLDALEVEEVWDRSGKTRHGYVDTSEAAYEMIREALDPYLEEMAKYHKLGMPAEAKRMCMGLLLGLYQFEHECTSKFKDWAPDAAGSYARVVVDAWKKGAPGRADVKAVKAFVEEELGGWCAYLFQK